MREVAIAFDTSNYTTSCAIFDGASGQNSGQLLDVEQGKLGLRQSDALFLHVKRLPEIIFQLELDNVKIIAVGASTQPRETADSYMPCFLAGVSQAKVLAKTLNVPFFGFSHQQGHIASAAWSSGHMELLETPHLAWHLSGGTTELLYVRPRGVTVVCQIVGGTNDLSAGQLIDRTGKLLGLSFPSGKELDKLANCAQNKICYSPRVDGLYFSISGVEHKMNQMLEKGGSAEDVAYFSICSIITTVHKITNAALQIYGEIPVLYSGGVASNSLLRRMTPNGIFAQPQFSTDNAMGSAILTYRAVKSDGK